MNSNIRNLKKQISKLKFHFLIYAVLMILIAHFASCTKDPVLSNPIPNPALTPFKGQLPLNFPPMNLAADNSLTEEGIELGRMLYYDTLLHPQKTMSCAGCHLQSHSFSKPGTDGVIPHVNLAWRRFFLWNGKISGSLEDAMKFEIEEFFGSDLRHIRNSPDYRARFKEIYGSEEVNTKRASYAMAQFLASLISHQSKFDMVQRRLAEFSPSEAAGAELFFSEKGDCFHCHPPPLFTDNAFHNVGVDTIFEGRHRGRFEVTGNPADMGRMLTPTLRNISVTGPYYHDGRFANLEEVIEHYNSGVKKSVTLDFLMLKNNATGLKNLSKDDIQNLKAFLLTLEDQSFLTNPKYGPPN